MSLESSTTILSPIENELPTYRAVSSLAVFSLLLGIGSVFTFADTRMAVLGVGALVAGLIALRKIKHYPDILTGARLARIGIALGLIFVLSATTFDYVQTLQGEAQVLLGSPRVTPMFSRTRTWPRRPGIGSRPPIVARLVPRKPSISSPRAATR